jgi:replication factor C subunit 2/4
MKNRLLSIIQEEEVKFSNDGSREEVLEEIMKLSNGDMRRAVTMLQSVHTLSAGRPVQKESISEITGFPPLQVTNSLLETLRDPKTHYEPLESKVSDVMMDGYAAQHILSKLLKDIIELDEAEMSDVFKAEIAIKIAEVDKILIDGADEYLQLLVVCSLVLQCFKRMATLK